MGFNVIPHCDITEQTDVDAIVNAANEWLAEGGGVDGAIHRAAGPELSEECRKIKPTSRGRRCPTGQVRITGAGRLPNKAIIHAVGPNCLFGYNPKKHDKLLASAWRNALELVEENGFKSVAFPSIATGIYSFPVDRAAAIAAKEVAEFLNRHPDIEVRLCLRGGSSKKKKEIYEQAFRDASGFSSPALRPAT